MQPGDIHTIQDFIRYCRETLADKPEYMNSKEQEAPAASIVSACCVESFDDLEKSYPQLTEIFDIAADLEWSNSYNTTIDWRRIRELVEQLDREIKQ